MKPEFWSGAALGVLIACLERKCDVQSDSSDRNKHSILFVKKEKYFSSHPELEKNL